MCKIDPVYNNNNMNIVHYLPPIHVVDTIGEGAIQQVAVANHDNEIAATLPLIGT